MPPCLICGKDVPSKICTECNERSVSSDGLANFDAAIINMPLREQIRILDKETFGDPENPALYYWKGLFQEFAGNMEEAIRSFDRANRCDPNFKWSWMRKGHILFELGRYREAIRAFQKAVELHPDDWQSYKVLGYCMQEERMFDQAIVVYGNALKIKSDEDSLYNSIGYCYSEEGEWAKAIEAYTKAQEINPNNPQTLFGLAKSYHHQNKFPEAIKVYTDAIAKGAKNADVWVGLGEAYLNTNEYDKAVDSYEKAITVQPSIKLKNQGKDLVGAIKDSLNIGGFGTESEQLAGKEANRLLNQAIKSFTEGNYRVALQSLREVSKLSEDAKRFYESTITLIKEDVKVLDRNNVEHSDIDKLLMDATLAFSKRSMTEAYTLAKIARARTTELIQPLVKQEAEETLKNTSQLYQELKAKSIDVGEAEDLLLKAQDAYSNQLYVETRSFGNKAYAILQGIYREYQRVQSLERIKATEAALESAQKEDVDVLALRKTLYDAKANHENRDYAGAMGVCAKINAELENLRREMMITKVKEKITVSRTILVDVKGAGFDIEDGNAILQRASEAFSEGDFEKALAEALELESLALRKQKDLKRKLAKDAIESASSIIKLGEGEGMDLSDGKMLVQEAAEAFEIEKFDMSTELAKKAQEIMEPMVNQLLEAKAKMMFNDVAKFVAECQGYGIDVAKPISVMSSSQDFYAQKKFLASIQVSQQVLGMLEAVRKEYLKNQSLAKINETNTALQNAQADYTEVDMGGVKSFLNQAVERFKEENYKASLELVNEGRKELDRLILEYQKKQTTENVATAKALLEQIEAVFKRANAEKRDMAAFEKRGAEAREQTETVREAFNQGNVEAAYKASFNLRVSIQALHEELMRTYCVLLLKELRELIGKVSSLGADMTPAQERFKLIQEPLRNNQYDIVFRSSDELRALVLEIKREFLMKKAQEAYEAAEKDISSAKDVGADVADLGTRFNEAKNLTISEKLEEAIKAFGDISRDAKDRMAKKLLADCKQALLDAQAVMKRALALGIDLAGPNQLLGASVQSLNAQDYTNCLEQAYKAKQETLEAEKQYYRQQAMAALKLAKEKMAGLAEQGLDVSRGQSEFDTAKPLLESEKYQEAAELAARVIRICDIIVLRDLCAKFKDTAAGVAVYLKQCTDLGIDVSGPTQQLMDVAGAGAEISARPDDKVAVPGDLDTTRKLTADAQRIRADGQAKRAAFFMDKAKGLYLKVRPNLERLKAYSLDVSQVESEVQVAVGHLKSNDPENASAAFEKALALSDVAIKDYLRQKAAESYEGMFTKLNAAKDEGVEVGDIPQKVSDVKPLLDAEEFEKAIIRFGELSKEIDAKVQEHRKGLAIKALNSAKEALLRLRSKNIDFTKANETLVSAKPAFEKADYLEVVRICKATEEVCAALELEHRQKLAQADIDAIKAAIEASGPVIEELARDFAQPKEDMSKPLEELLSKANTAFESKEYESTQPLVQKATEYKDKLANLLATLRLKRDAEASIKKCEDAIEPFAAEGVDLATVLASLDESKQMLSHKEYDAVIKREPELMKALEVKVQEYRKAQAVKALNSAKQALLRLRSKNIDFTKVNEALAGAKPAFERADYLEVVRLCKAAEELCADLELAHRKNLALANIETIKGATDASNPIIEELSSAFAQPRDEMAKPFADLLAEANGAFERQDFEGTLVPSQNAVAHQKSLAELLTQLRLRRDSEASIKRCEEAQAPLAGEGIDLTTAKAFVDESKAMHERKEYQAVIAREPEMGKILAGARAYHFKQLAAEAMKASRDNIKALAQLGVGIKDLQNALVAVKAKFDAGEYEPVINECKSMDQEILALRANFYNGRIAEMMKALRTALDNYKAEGMDVAQFEEAGRPMFEGFSALDPKDPANEDLFNRVTMELPPLAATLENAHKEFLKMQAREAAHKVIEAMSAAKTPIEQEGIEITDALKYLEETNRMFSDERYSEIPGRELQMQNLLEAARVQHYKRIAQADMDRTKGLLSGVKDIDLSMHWAQLNEAGQAFAAGRYSEASSVSKAVEAAVESALHKWRLDTLAADIDALGSEITTVEPSGMEVGGFKGQHKGFGDAFSGLNREDREAVKAHFEATVVQVREAREALRKAHADHLKQKAREKAEAVLAEMQAAIEAADKAWDLSKAIASLDEARSLIAQEKFEEVAPKKELLDKIIEVARKKYQKEQLVSRFTVLKEELKDLRAVGVDAQPFGQRLVSAKEVFMKKELDETAKLLEAISSDMTLARGNKLISDSKGSLSALEAKMSEARPSGMDMSRFDTELDNMKKAGEALKPAEVENAKQYREMVVPTCTQLTTELAAELAAFIKEKERKASEEFISSLNKQADEAKAAGLDVAGALEVVKKASDLHSKEDYKTSVTLGPEFAKALELAKKKKLKTEALAEIEKAKAALKAAKAAGADVSPLVKDLANTKPVFQAGKYEEALEITKRVSAQSEELRAASLKADAEKKLRDLDSRLDEASGLNIQELRASVTRLREALESAADPAQAHAQISAQHPKIVEDIDKLKNASERDKAKARAEEARKYVEGRAEEVTGIPRCSKLDMSPALQAAMDALKAAEGGQIKDSNDKCDEARKRADVIVNECLLKASTNAIAECQAMLEEAKVSGADTLSAEDELSQAKKAAAAEDFRTAISLADSAMSTLKKTVSEREKNDLIRFLERVEADIEAAKKEDQPGWKEAYSLLEAATDSFNNNDLEATRTKAIEAAEALKKGRKEQNEKHMGDAKGNLDNIEMLLTKLGQMKGKGHYHVMFDALKEEFNDGNYKDVCEKAEILSKKIEEELEKALAQALPQKPPEPAKPEPPKAPAPPKEEAAPAEQKPEAPKTAEAPKPPAPAPEPSKNSEAIQETIKRLEFHISKAPPGMNLSEPKEFLLQAKDAAANGDPYAAVEYARKCKESLKNIGNVVNEIKTDLKSAFEKIKGLKAQGKDVSALEGDYLKAKAAFTAGDYNIAKSLAKDLLAKVP